MSFPTRKTTEPVNLDRDEFLKTLPDSIRNLNYKKNCLDAFLRFCQESLGHTDLNRARSKDIQAYAVVVVSGAAMKQTKRLKLQIVLQWFQWLADQGRIVQNPFKNLAAATLIDEAIEKKLSDSDT